MTARSAISIASRPTLSRDPSFWAMTATQFLGAFNDNLFKQLVLLICVDHAARFRGGEDVYQPVAMALFAVPFVMFSGLGGYLSDRHSKRTIVVLCKAAEIVVMFLGMAAFLSGRLEALFVVLFCMSTQSAFFGPAKYGILPEMLRERDLPQANGIIQMTTFVAIIFGMALAGFSKEWLQGSADDWTTGRLWIISAVCGGIAVAGTLTSLAVRRTPVARPGLPLTASAWAISRSTWNLLRSDRQLFSVLLVSSLFWFVGGVVQPTVNAFGKLQLNLGDGRTSMLAASMGVGIAAGCLLAGKASKRRTDFRLVTWGATGIVICLALAALLGMVTPPAGETAATAAGNSLRALMMPTSSGEWAARATMTGLGLSAGFFIVPLQVFLQARPPKDQKGRMIGAMNLVNWIAIVLSAVFYQAAILLVEFLELRTAADTPQVHWIFAALSVVLLPIAVFYRPSDGRLETP